MEREYDDYQIQYPTAAAPSAGRGWRWEQRTPAQTARPGHYWNWQGGWDQNGQGWQEVPSGGWDQPNDPSVLPPTNNTSDTNDYGLNYWQGRGQDANDIFDIKTGQLKPGWRRTARGYENDSVGPALDKGGGGSAGVVGGAGSEGASASSLSAGAGGSFDSSGFAWPKFNAPAYTPGPGFQAPKPFEFESFKGPEFSDIYKDGSYKGRRDEGLQAIEHGAAAKGLSRLPQTLKALSGWNQDFASREYGNIWDRSANTYDRNRNNAADTYSRNYGVSRDVWDRGEQQNLSAFDRNYTGKRDMFDFNEWKPASATFDDLYRRYKAELDATTAIATAGAGV